LLVDFVSYSGEAEMLQARLQHMEADLTVVYESTRSFTGIDKPVSDLSGLEDVLHYVVEGGTDPNPWANEYAFRREAFAYLLSLGLPDDALVAVCDVDEFLDLELIRPELSVWNITKYQMSARWFQQVEWASLSGALGHFKDKDLVDLIRSRENLPAIRGGWHFSSFLSLEDLQTKWRNFSHQELVRENMDQWVEKCWLEGLAVENGNPMTQLADLPDLPAAVLDGPAFWFRGRNDS
jgi:hypothetical protein